MEIGEVLSENTAKVIYENGQQYRPMGSSACQCSSSKIDCFATGRQIIFYHYGKDPDKEIHLFLNLDLDHGLFVIVSHRVSQIELLHYGKHGLVFCKRFV